VTCQCRFCGRVRIGTKWVRDASVEPDVVGYCPPCGRLRADKMVRDYASEGRRLLRQRKAGYGPCRDGEDEFKGFKGE
jgi:hypothetical protein